MRFNRIKGDPMRATIRLPRLGKLRLGVKVVSEKTGKEYPRELDYFICPPEVQAKFGQEPKTLPVMIPVEDEERFFRQYYACYGSNQKVKCQGDGEKAERRVDAKRVEMDCPSPGECDFAKDNDCRARMDIMFVIPDVNCGGVYQLSSGSINTDIDIRSGLEMAKSLFGRVSWVPMKISREKALIPDPGTGKMMQHWPVKLYPDATITETNQIRANTDRILDRQSTYALPEPEIEGEPDTPTVREEDMDVEVAPEAPAEPATPIATIANESRQANHKDILEHLRESEHLPAKGLIECLRGAESAEDIRSIWRLLPKHMVEMTGPEKAAIQAEYDQGVKKFKNGRATGQGGGRSRLQAATTASPKAPSARETRPLRGQK